MTIIGVVWKLKTFDLEYKQHLSKQTKGIAIDRKNSVVYVSLHCEENLYWRTFDDLKIDFVYGAKLEQSEFNFFNNIYLKALARVKK